MRKTIAKRSIIIHQHKTSISLEDEFWDSLAELASARGKSIKHVVEEIENEISDQRLSNLSSAVRVHILKAYKSGELPAAVALLATPPRNSGRPREKETFATLSRYPWVDKSS